MTDDGSRLLAADVLDQADQLVETTLRPRTLEEYIGQREVKANLSVLLRAARGKGEAAGHGLARRAGCAPTSRLDLYDGPAPPASARRPGGILDVPPTESAAGGTARRGRGTPRIVNRLLKRVRDHAEVHGDGRVDEAAV